MTYCEIYQKLVKEAPVSISSIITPAGLRGELPDTLSVSKPKWNKAFGNQEDDQYKAGLYIFWFKGKAKSIDQDTGHWVKGKQQGKLDPTELGEGACYFPNKVDDETDFEEASDESKVKNFLHYRGQWTFHPIVIEDDLYIPLYVGKSTNVHNRVKQHLRWPSSHAKLYADKLAENLKDDLHIIPRYNTASQLSDHFHFLFQKEEDLGQAKKKNNVYLSVCFTDFADYESRFFYEDRLIGELRPPFNLDSER